MKIYKHNSKEQYCFIQEQGYEKTCIFIEKGNSTFTSQELADNKELKKIETQIIKEGFQEYEVEREIAEKTEKFIKNIELKNTYNFVLSDIKNPGNSLIATFELSKSASQDNEYKLDRFSTEQTNSKGEGGFGTLGECIQGLGGYIQRDELESKYVANVGSFYVQILFFLGFEVLSPEEIISLRLGKKITNQTHFDTKIYKFIGAEFFYKVDINEKLGFAKFSHYVCQNGIVTQSHISYYLMEEEKEQINLSLASFEDTSKFEVISQKQFESECRKKQKNEIFQAPKLTQPNLDIFPLDIPSQIIEIDHFFDHYIEPNKYYFFANTQEKSKEDWLVTFICYSDEKENYYLYAKPFLLKDFNKKISQPEEVELSSSREKDDFIKQQKRVFKRNGLKALSTQIIYEFLSGKQFEILTKQKQESSFVIDKEDYIQVFDIYENYACVRENLCTHVYWQFFQDSQQRNKWLKKYKEKQNELYETDRNYIDVHTKKYLEINYGETAQLKKDLIKSIQLQNFFEESNNKKKFLASENVLEKTIHSDSDYIFNHEEQRHDDSKTIVITGDIIVKNTLAILNPRGNFMIIQGDIKAKNLIIDRGIGFLYVEGRIEVENITSNSYNIYCTEASTNILLSNQLSGKRSESTFQYESQIGYYSDAIIDKSVITKDSSDYLNWNYKRIVELLSTDQIFLSKPEEHEEENQNLYYKDSFMRYMKNWGNFYPELAGCRMLDIYEDDEVEGSTIYPSSGDWVVDDVRGKTGTYGVSHEDFSICKVKVKKPEKFGVDYKQKPISTEVSSLDLMKRYQNISMLYMNWSHRKTPSLEHEQEGNIVTNQNYETEKKFLVQDPYLALYWLHHFGATLDDRYKEVAEVIEKNNLTKKLEALEYPLAFFKETDEFYNMEIHEDDPDLFLKRRAYLIYLAHTYQNYNANNLDLWWKSIIVYPKIEEQLIVRMRWLKNNLKKCNQWSEFDIYINEATKSIPLISYILACNPNLSDEKRKMYGDILVDELLKYKNFFQSDHKKLFAQALLWDIRKYINKKDVFKEAAKLYFQENYTSQEYIDIQESYGEKNENIEDIKNIIKKIEKEYKKHNSQESVFHIFHSIKEELLGEVIINISDTDIQKIAFVYLWNHNIEGKKEIMKYLFIHIEFSGYNIKKELFGNSFPNFITDQNDPNIEVAQELLLIPVSEFKNDYVWKKSKEAAVKFFLTSMHLKKVFNFFIDYIKQKNEKSNHCIKEAIYSSLFSLDYDTQIDPTRKFSQDQIETLFNTICERFIRYGGDINAIKCIYNCSIPQAKKWIESKINDKKWIHQFAGVQMGYDSLQSELEDALESALENIEHESLITSLELQNDNNHVFWKIASKEHIYYTIEGIYGEKGKEVQNTCNGEEECKHKVEELIQKKLEEGYIRV